MEASALPASVGLARARLGLGASLLRLRSDEQLVSLFRAGNEDAFRVIHDRYRARILAYARQMLASSPADAEDAVQEIFVRAYSGLRANRRDLALRAWLYRIAHNRCIDDLRRPHPIAVEAVEELGEAAGWVGGDIHARVEQREALRRLIADVRRLPEQQRSALLMRELGGMPYADLAGALGTSVPAVKSLLVRARVGLVQASEARDIACDAIREDLIVAHDRGVRASGRSRRHLRDCPECRRFRTEVQGTSRRLGLLLPALGPIAALAKLVGVGGLSGGGGAAAGSGTTAAAGSGAAAGTTGAAAGTAGAAAGTAGAAGAAAGTAGAAAGTAGAASTGALASAGAAASAGHIATVLAATAIAAGGAIGIQHEVSGAGHSRNRIHRPAALAALPMAPAPPAAARTSTPQSGSTAGQSQTATRDGGVSAAAASTAGTAHAAHVTKRSPTAVVSGASGVVTTTSTSTIPLPTVTTAPTETTSATGTSTATTTSTTTSTTGGAGTITDPTTGASPTPISGSGTQTEPTTSTSTTPPSRGNPGTATGIVPTVSSATAGTGSRAISRRIRLRAWRDAPRELPAGSADAP